MEISSITNYFYITSIRELKQKGIIFSENDIIEGKVISVSGNKLVLNIKGENILAESDLKFLPSEELTLQVIRYTSDKIIMKLLSRETKIFQENFKYFSLILKNLPFLEDKLNKILFLNPEFKNSLKFLTLENFLDSLNTPLENKILNEKNIENDIKFIFLKLLNFSKNTEEKNIFKEIISNIQNQQLLNFLNYYNKTALPFYYQIPLFYQDKFFTMHLKIYPEKIKNKKISLDNLKITILLNPPELGIIKIDILFKKEFLSFLITTEREKTKNLVDENFNILKEKLETIGFKNIKMRSKFSENILKEKEEFLKDFEFFSKKIDVIV
jgi:hypothetical protein